jgi:hypothetical protein
MGYLRWLPETERDEGRIVFEVDYAIVEGLEDTRRPVPLPDMPARVRPAAERRGALTLSSPLNPRVSATKPAAHSPPSRRDKARNLGSSRSGASLGSISR